MKENKYSAAWIAKMAMMTAISLVLMFIIRIPFPPAPYLVYDPADIPIYITAFAYGPGAGLIVTLVVSLLQAFALGGDGLYGFLMHVVATGLVSVVIGAMYKNHKTKKMALTALVVGVVLNVIVMCGMNLLITPLYTGMEVKAVAVMLPTVIAPFNLIKQGINAAVTFVLYKKLSRFLHKN